MRGTFDRLIGPLVVESRTPENSMATLSAAPTLALVPREPARWKVVAGTRPTATLLREVAGCATSDDVALQRAASRFGLLGRGDAVDRDRAAKLVASVRDGRTRAGRAPLREALVDYAPDEDPRPMWNTQMQPDFFERDQNDDIADGLAWCLRTVAGRTDFAAWEQRANAIARAWQPDDGVARLHRLARSGTRPSAADSGWPVVFALALLRASTKVRDARMAWHALATIGPVLLSLAGADERMTAADRALHLSLLVDAAEPWRQLATEARAWLTILDELPNLEEELERIRRNPRAGDPSTREIKAAVRGLDGELRGRGINLLHRVHDLEATDTDAIRATLEDVVTERLGRAGVDAGTPAGTLIGLEAAMLLSVRAALVRKGCLDCGRHAVKGRPRCAQHDRDALRDRKRAQRRNSAKSKRPAGQSSR